MKKTLLAGLPGLGLELPEERVDRLLVAGQLLSIRGFGRVRLVEVGSPTRRDRLPIVLEVFAKT